MCKYKKYCKGPPISVLAKNIKYIPENLVQTEYVPNVPDFWYRSGTKPNPPLDGNKFPV